MPFVYSVRGKHNSSKKEHEESILDFVKVTGGDKVYTAGGYVIHTFLKTGPADLTITPISHTLPEKVTGLIRQGLDVEFLVVGGGGAGGSRHGGGGGAGAMVEGTTGLGVGPNAVNVGAAGAGVKGDSQGGAGGPSSLTPLIVALGGGGGGSWGGTAGGAAGGSGGGSSGPSTGITGTSQRPPQVLPNASYYGNPGGSSTVWGNPINYLRVGGGGGAGTKGENAELIGPNGGGRNQRGGDGRTNSITGTQYYWAAGGGGQGWTETGGSGGAGGGGGASPGGAAGTGGINAGTAGAGTSGGTDGVGGNGGTNTGSGGGGSLQTPSTGGNGGSGIVVVRYRR